MFSIENFKSRLSNFIIYALIGVVAAYLGSRVLNYYRLSNEIEVTQVKITALGEISGEVSTIKSKKDLLDKVGQSEFALLNKSLFEKAGIENTDHIANLQELEARKRRPKKADTFINNIITSIKTLTHNLSFELKQKGYQSRYAFNNVKKNFEKTMWKGARSSENWRANLDSFRKFTERVKNTKMDNDFKNKLLYQLGRIMDKHQDSIRFLVNEEKAATSETSLMNMISDLKENVPSLIIGAVEEKNTAHKRFYRTVLGDTFKLAMSGFVLLALVVIRLKKTTDTEIKGLRTKNRRRGKEVRAANEQLGMIERESFVATAILDENEDFTWASNSFKKMLGFNKSGVLPNWRRVFERDVFDHSEATGIKGAVKLRNDLQADYILRSKMERNDGVERRIIQIWPVEEYYQELAGENALITIPKEAVKEEYTEIGNLIEDLLVKMGVFFQSMRVNVDLGSRLPTLTTANEESLTLGLANVLKGLVFYLGHTKQGDELSITFTKTRGRVNFKVEASKARIDLSEIDKELCFKNKNYHSLGYYLTECERVLEAYGANVGIRNFLSADKANSVAVIEVGINEKIELKVDTKKEFRNIRFNKELYATEVEGVN